MEKAADPFGRSLPESRESRKGTRRTRFKNVESESAGEGSAEDAKFRSIVEAAGWAGHGITILQNIGGREGVITFVNASFAKTLGYTRDELLGKRFAEFIHPDSVPIVSQHYRRRRNGQYVPAKYEAQGLNCQGHPVPLEISGATATIDGEVVTVAFITNVSKRKQTEKKLQESEEKYGQLVENVNAVVYAVDTNGVVTYMSPVFEDIYGHGVSEFVGKRFAEFIYPDDLPASMENLSKVLVGLLKEPWECRMVLPGSPEIYWVQGHNRPIYESGVIVGFQGVLIDITSKKQAEQAMQKSEEKYRLLVESSPDGILSVDHNGRIVDCNNEICRLLGYSRGEVLGCELTRMVSNGSHGVVQPFNIIEVNQSGFVEAEMDMIHCSGRIVPVWAKVVARGDAAGRGELQVVIYLRDMAERRKIEELKDQFISLVSHELRTPLTVVMGAVNTALAEGRRLPQTEVRRLLLDAVQGSEELSHILENLLELSRAQAGKVRLNLDTVRLDDMLLQVANKARQGSERHTLILKLPRRMPAVLVDRLRVERVLHNLIDNAIKYSSGGNILISARKRGDFAVIEVRDKGIGISQEDQERLFQPFQRIRDEDTEGTKGTGLGLLVCRKLVEAHGGKIWVESDVGQGSAFFFTLPLQQAGNQAA